MTLLQNHSSKNFLNGQLLIAMPQMRDDRFNHAVIYICGHDEQGAMGLVVNKLIDDICLSHLLIQLGIESTVSSQHMPINFGGPIEMGRGFVLHTPDYMHEHSALLSDGIALTVTLDILNIIATGQGPAQKICALGYVGWSQGQLEQEIKQNLWLQIPVDANIVFNQPIQDRWQKSMLSIGISLEQLSLDVGHA